ncbi:MAG: helix-hairpin-helix domain-containing protein [Myxococcota bacterium]
MIAHTWWGVAVALCLAACGTTPATVEHHETHEPENEPLAGPALTVRMIDVGQGDGILILSPNGKSILIDAGDRGKDAAVLAQLAADKVESLDLVIMSHPHADHIGGMQKVLERVPAKIFLDPGFDYSSGIYTDLLAHLEQAKTQVIIARAGRKIDIGGDAYLLVLAPKEPLLGGTRSDANANSIVVKLVYGQTSMLFTGDSEAPTESRLLDDPAELHADILKVAHHGSEYSTTESFLAAVHPSIAVISCGVDNKFHHPGPTTLARIEAAGIQVIRTDLNGTITLVTDGTRWRTAVAKGEIGLPPPVAAHTPTTPTTPPTTTPVVAQEPEDPMDTVAPPTSTPPTPPTTVPMTAPGELPGGKLDLNQATLEQLMTVEGIGKGKAQAILDYRAEHGPFKHLDEVNNVKGIGHKLRELIAQKFTIVRSGEGPTEDAHDLEGPRSTP